ncbi:hypothetical protein HZY91_08380 [Facklamia sp. DSM 111018]|uniref:Uncharacterized protein n=1 Tax=Facklamia lactis TaxID=2749967 RepID=A0ABS0LRV1_9LACT|nr:hypothetical protein [Facklamia lactis]MBG9986902.1 hypothetical protein [Facklamia lactis]
MKCVKSFVQFLMVMAVLLSGVKFVQAEERVNFTGESLNEKLEVYINERKEAELLTFHY